MKYFTMDELDNIANELLNNPSRETLKFLNDKYNGEIVSNNADSKIANKTTPTEAEVIQTNFSKSVDNNIPKVEIPIWQPAEQLNNQPTIYSSINNDIKKPQEVVANLQMGTLHPTSQESSINIPSLNIQPDMNISPEPISNTVENKGTNLEINQVGINNNSNTVNPVQFNGNLWERQDSKVNSMMQTTDNFNNNLETEQNSNVNNSFFNPLPNQNSNSIPIYESTVQEGPTVFGQFEQDFNNNEAA